MNNFAARGRITGEGRKKKEGGGVKGKGTEKDREGEERRRERLICDGGTQEVHCK